MWLCGSFQLVYPKKSSDFQFCKCIDCSLWPRQQTAEAVFTHLETDAAKLAIKQSSGYRPSFPVSVQYITVGIYAPVPEERPAAADIFGPVKVNVHDLNAFLVLAELGQYLTLWAGGERISPEIKPDRIS